MSWFQGQLETPRARQRTWPPIGLTGSVIGLLLVWAASPAFTQEIVGGARPIQASVTDGAPPLQTDDAVSVTVSLPDVDQNHVLNPTRRTLSRYFVDPFVRAGSPDRISPWAIPSTLPNQYSGGYVGGGVPWLGEGRYSDEGVFGVDYDGVLPKRVWLRWTHGRRYQGGTQGYRTDGPKLHLEH